MSHLRNQTKVTKIDENIIKLNQITNLTLNTCSPNQQLSFEVLVAIVSISRSGNSKK